MNLDRNLVRPAAPQSPPGDAALLDAEWSSRPTEELRAIVQHGLRDDSFSAAASELERRARTLSEKAEQRAEANRADHRLFARFVLGGLIALGILGLILGAWMT